MWKKKTDRFDVAAKMPRIKHQSDAGFSCETSDVAAWLVRQPEIKKFVFDRVREAGLIVFDQASRTWRGKDTP